MMAFARLASVLLCAGMALGEVDSLTYTELGGGSLSHPLLMLCQAGGWLLLCAAAGTAWLPRLAMPAVIVGSACCLPLYAFRVAPRSVSWLATAPPSAPPQGFWQLERLALGGLLALAVMAAVQLAWWQSERSGAKQRNTAA